MIKRLALGRVPAMATFLFLAGMASPTAAQLATSVATSAATPTSTPATPTAAAPVTSTPVTSIPATATPVTATPAPATTATTPATTASATTATSIAPAEIGRSAILSTSPRPLAGTTPPAGTAVVQPAVTHAGLWPLVYAKQTGHELNSEEQCLAIAVYHEARGEPLDGQLAVAEVIMNRAASGRYPASWCGVMTQPWQFSFVNPRTGRYPGVKVDSAAWSYAQAIARIASGRLADALPGDVLWYHADYVAPSWGRRLAKVDKIGAHIFYRAFARS